MLTNFPSTNLLHETSAGERAEASASAAPSLDPALLGTQMTPLERLSALEENSAMGLNPPMKCRPRILVVDDDDFEFELLEDVFGAEYEVLFAKDGLAALQIAAEKRPDLILLDVMMPKINGYEVCRRLKSLDTTSDIPIIFISGLGNMSSETTGLQLGAVDYITKPINTSAVRVKAINQIQFKRSLDHLVRTAHMEKELRDDLLAVLELRSLNQPVH